MLVDNTQGQEIYIEYGNGTKDTWAYEAGTGKLEGLTTEMGSTVYQEWEYEVSDAGNVSTMRVCSAG